MIKIESNEIGNTKKKRLKGKPCENIKFLYLQTFLQIWYINEKRKRVPSPNIRASFGFRYLK